MSIKVLHTIASLKSTSGGPSRTVTSLCNALGQKGGNVSLLTMDRPAELASCVEPDYKVVNLRTVSGPNIPLLKARYPFGHFKEISVMHSDIPLQIIHDHGLWLPCNHAVAAVANRIGLPYVVSPRGMLEPWALNYKSLKKNFVWKLWARSDLRSATAFCATSVKEAENIRALGFKQPIAVIPNGVHLPPFPKVSTPKKNGNRKALFLSRIHPVKGVCELVDAWAKVRPPGWELLIAGPDEGGHGDVVRRRIINHGLGSSIRMIGSVEDDEKWLLYRESELFVLPTFSENFGVVVAEALSMETPVITTKGAPWEALVQHGCGWWVDFGVEPLAQALSDATVLSDDVLFAMGKRGRILVEREFAWEEIAAKMMQFYLWLLDMAEKPDFVRGHSV